jgi:hypothetical protein
MPTSKLKKLDSLTKFICNFHKQMPKLPAKWYSSLHISKWDESSPLPMKIYTSFLRNKFEVIFKRSEKNKLKKIKIA